MQAFGYAIRKWTAFEWKAFLIGTFGIFAASILIFLWFEAQTPKDFASWKTTKGRVYEIALQPMPGSLFSGDRNFKLVILYGYTVAGVRYTSTKARFGPAPRGKGVRMRNRYEALFSAPEIDVYYDPKEHSNAVVDPPVAMPVGTALLAATAFSLVFAGIFALAKAVERRPGR